MGKYPHILARINRQKKLKTNPVYETMTYWQHRYSWYIVRVWNDEKEWSFGPNKEIIEVLDDMINNPPLCYSTSDSDQIPTYQWTPKDIVKKLCEKFPTISAIEILDSRTKCGGLYYPDWK